MLRLFLRPSSKDARTDRGARRKEISPSDRVRLAHEERVNTDSGRNRDKPRGEKILALIAGLISAVIGYLVFSEVQYIPPLAAIFLVQLLGGVVLLIAASWALADREPLSAWVASLTWWALLFALMVISVFLYFSRGGSS